MEIDYSQLILGLPTRIKDKEYFSTKAYVEPFFDRMSKFTNDFRIQVKPADQISLTSTGEVNFDNIVYNRVYIEAILPDEYAFEGHKKVVGFVYALDTRKPIVKEFVGGLRCACLNLCTFNTDALSVQELNPEEAINYSFLNNCMTMVDDINTNLRKLSEMEITREDCQLKMWIDNCLNPKINAFNSGFGNVKLAESMPIEVYKDLFIDDKSDYYSEEGIVTGFNAYNAFTDIICNGRSNDIVNRFEKVYLVKNILGL